MMARVRKWTARCLSATVVSFFCLVRVSVFCSILTWNVPNLLCRAKRPWSCAEGGRGVLLEHVLLSLGGRPSSKTQGLGLGLRLEFGPGGGAQRDICGCGSWLRPAGVSARKGCGG